MTLLPKSIQVYFLHVADNAAKLKKLCAAVHSHFIKRDKILIFVPSSEAASYIDQLLWKMPEESFIPHAIANGPTKEQIAITTSLSNINQATTLINLTGAMHPNPGPADTIYELYDSTSKEKEELSRIKQNDYRCKEHMNLHEETNLYL